MNISTRSSAAGSPAVPGQTSSLLAKSLLVILSILVWVGVGAGVFVGVYALSTSYSITIYLTIIACFLVGIALSISLWGKTGRMKRTLAIDLFLISSGVILLFAFLSQLRPEGPGIFLSVLALLILTTIVLAWLKPEWLSWLSDIYNAEKAFGGTTFVEYASFMGVVGALGAHAGLASDAAGWYWMGHFGTLLALAAGLSLFWRWLRFEDDKVPAYLCLCLVFFTLISLALTPNLDNWYVRIVWPVFIGLTGFLLIFVSIKSRNLRAENNWRKPPQGPLQQQIQPTSIVGWERFWLWSFTGVICLAGGSVILLIWLPVFGIQPGDVKIPVMVFNAAAQICWIAAEGWNVYKKSQVSWSEALAYHEWEKNLWNIFGGSTLIFFILSPLWTGDPLPIESTYIFILGIAFGLLGTLRGILVGMIKKYG